MIRPNSTTFENPYDLYEKTIAYLVVLFLTLFGNMFIIITIYTDGRLKLTSNFLVANMAVSDLVSSLVFVPSKIGLIYYGNTWPLEGTFGDISCKLSSFLPKTSTSVSFYSCLFIAVDRYLAVAYPLRGGFRRSRLKYIIPAIWIFSALIVSPYFYSFQVVVDITGSPFCKTKDESIFQTHFYILLALNLGVPLPIITTLYILIVYKLHRHKAPGNQSDHSRKRREQQNRKVLKMSITIVGLLSLSWGFFSIVIILGFNKIVVENLTFFAIFLAHLSYTYNFFIYLIFNDIYRENFKSMISKLCCKIKCTRVARVNIAERESVANGTLNNQTQLIEIKKTGS